MAPFMPLLPTMLAAQILDDSNTCHPPWLQLEAALTNLPPLMASVATAACSTEHHMLDSCGMLAAANTRWGDRTQPTCGGRSPHLDASQSTAIMLGALLVPKPFSCQA